MGRVIFVTSTLDGQLDEKIQLKAKEQKVLFANSYSQFPSNQTNEIKMTLDDNQLIYRNNSWVLEQSNQKEHKRDDGYIELEAENNLLKHKLKFALDMVHFINSLHWPD